MYSSWVEISTSAIIHNLYQFQKLVGKNTAVMPIVKSNAYGHGMIEIAKLVSPKVKWLGVVNLGEALMLRQRGIKKSIFVLSYAQEKHLTKGIKSNISLPVYDLNYAKIISNKAKKIKTTAKIHVKIDTGTTRIGVLTNDAIEFIKKIRSLPFIKIEGIYSHFATSKENESYTKKQLASFNSLLLKLEEERINIQYKHISCSAATLMKHQTNFDLVRIGISFYGLWPGDKVKRVIEKNHKWFELKPALKWKAKILQVKQIAKGTKVGYGCTYEAKKKMKIAVVAVGYWEGYDRHLSNRGIVVIKNKRCNVIGRICMNMTMVDVSAVRGVKAGDVMELIGQRNSADEMANKIGTINYEVITRINPLLKRIYLK